MAKYLRNRLRGDFYVQTTERHAREGATKVFFANLKYSIWLHLVAKRNHKRRMFEKIEWFPS